MKWPFPLYSPEPPTFSPCSCSYPVCICVGSDACHSCFFFTPTKKKKSGKRWKKECSENTRHYYRAACMVPLMLSFHLGFLLHWQMVVIRQYGNTVVKIVFTDFFYFFPLWYLWPDDHHESIAVLNRGPICQCCMNQENNMCHMGEMLSRKAEVWVQRTHRTSLYYNPPKCWYQLKDWLINWRNISSLTV